MIGNTYGPGTGRIVLDDVHCVGNETSIADCAHGGAGVHNCQHSEDVSVSCSSSPVQFGNATLLKFFVNTEFVFFPLFLRKGFC